MGGYTKFPWKAYGGEVCTEDYISDGQTMFDHICSCEVVNGESPNARLISAAPELLEALQICAGYLGGLDHSSAIYIAMMDKANEAIDKALGQ